MKLRRKKKLQPPEVFGNVGSGVKKIPNPPPPVRARFRGLLQKVKLDNEL